MEKINVAELLKDCPKGMELNCLMYDGCTFDGIIESEDYPIKIQAPDGSFVFTRYGSMSEDESAKCVIFPKGKNTWEGFQRPFKDGDIIATGDKLSVQVSIFKEYIKARNNYVRCYMMLDNDGTLATEGGNYYALRLATEKEKEKLFRAIKENGYSWNAETKTLERLVRPKFKLGQNIRIKGESTTHIVTEVRKNLYILDIKDISLPFENQDQWELVPNKLGMTYNEFERKLYNCDTILETVRLCVTNNELAKNFIEKQGWLKRWLEE